jgi:hypothetical protein
MPIWLEDKPSDLRHLKTLLVPLSGRAAKGRQTQEAIELSVDEELHRLHRRTDNSIDVFAGINTDMRGDRRQEHMLGRAQRGDPNSLAPQVGDAVDVLIGE